MKTKTHTIDELCAKIASLTPAPAILLAAKFMPISAMLHKWNSGTTPTKTDIAAWLRKSKADRSLSIADGARLFQLVHARCWSYCSNLRNQRYSVAADGHYYATAPYTARYQTSAYYRLPMGTPAQRLAEKRRAFADAVGSAIASHARQMLCVARVSIADAALNLKPSKIDCGTYSRACTYRKISHRVSVPYTAIAAWMWEKFSHAYSLPAAAPKLPHGLRLLPVSVPVLDKTTWHGQTVYRCAVLDKCARELVARYTRVIVTRDGLQELNAVEYDPTPLPMPAVLLA